MEIVPATEKHIPEMVELWKEFMEFHKDIDPRFPMRQDAALTWEKHVRELIKSENVLVLVALDKGKLIAYSVSQINRYAPIWEREIYGTIDEMAVTASYRRRGIGSQMVTKICEWLESRKVDRVELSVAAQNQVANSFWKKQGFMDYSHRLYLDRKNRQGN